MNYQKILLDNVPRFIEHIKKRGGVHPQEWEWIEGEEIEEVLNFADKYILYPSNEADLREGIFTLVRAITILSFIPGGVRIFEIHFDASLPGYAELEN